MPNIYDWWLHEGRSVNGVWYAGVNRRYIGRGGHKPRAIFLHIQEGQNLGSWEHFHTVTASSTVLIGKNGDIWRLVPESDGPWTNGDVSAPTTKGVRLMNQYGWDPNWYSLTIETEGYTDEWPKPKAQLDSVVWQIRTWMDRYGIPLENVMRHADINSTSRRFCPGDAFYNDVIKALNGDAPYTAPLPTPATYAKPQPPMVNGKVWDGLSDVTINGAVFHADRRTVTTTGVLNLRQWASTTSDLVGDPLDTNTRFDVLGWVNGENVNGEMRWWVTKYGSRVWVGGTVEKPSLAKPDDAPDNDNRPWTPVIGANGTVFYPMGADGAGREVTLIEDANLRQWASLEAPVVKVANKGSTVKVRYWCYGPEVDGESVWWVLDAKDPIQNGPRMWAGTTDTRPR